ncbi:MAG: hypothetical protein HY273_05815 [Gammaproteobacteria bacterium]|nr:hypothetical protein [Gammaproteobacteria bacterium]
MKLFQTALFTVCVLGISGCATEALQEAEPVVDTSKVGVSLLYAEKETGSSESALRLFVNAEFIRIDDQTAPNDYILFDRKKRTIYNVMTAEKSVSIISPRAVTAASPIPIAYTEEKNESAAITRGAENTKGYYYKFFANGVACYNVVVAEDFLPDVVKAFAEFRTVLAGEHATALGNLPPDRLDACDLALNIFYPARHLEFGFPVREWNDKGYSKFLREARHGVIIDPALLTIPADYARYPFGVKPH